MHFGKGICINGSLIGAREFPQIANALNAMGEDIEALIKSVFNPATKEGSRA